MSDGLNDARAMRVAEVMNDFRTTQLRISACNATPSAQEYQAAGYGILRQCHAEAQAVLSTHFDIGLLEAQSTGEATKRQLQRILLDASARRFRVHKIYLRAAAAMRWITRRSQYLQGQNPGPAHATVLRQIDDSLRAELLQITDQRVYSELLDRDNAAGNWTAEMADLNSLLAYIQSH